MNKDERYTKNVKLISWGSGQSNRTAQYGAQYIFKTNENEKLYWDTTSNKIDITVGTELTVSFKIKNTGKDLFWLGDNDYDVTNVRLIK